jgi:hypothetical protein
LFKRLVTASGVLVVALALAMPALAKPRLVLQKSSPAHVGAIVVSQGLLPGHQYRIQVSSSGHVKIVALGTQQIVFVANGRMGTLPKAVDFKGSTPYTRVLKQPAKITALSWIFAMQVTDQVRKALTVKLYDLGVHG